VAAGKARQKLAWLFNHLKSGETLMDVFHNVDIGRRTRSPRTPSAASRTWDDVFKSGWGRTICSS
jgi:hypothetical protein